MSWNAALIELGLGLCLLAGHAAGQHTVWVVDSAGLSGDVDFDSVRDAVAIAQDGDTIVVRPGDYDDVTITNRAVNLVSDDAQPVVLDLRIDQLDAGKLVSVRNFVGGIELVGNAGAVWIEEHQGWGPQHARG